MRPTAALGIAWLATLSAGAACAGGAPDPQPVGAVLAAGEHGSFLLHKFQQQIGEEHWSVAPGPAGPEDAPVLRVDFRFTDRGAPVALTATLQARTDGTPLAFAVHGRTARQVEIDDDVEARSARVQVRQGSASHEADRPQRFFTIAAYAPVAVQQLLLRYWRAHGAPEELATFPSGRVRIEHRGRDAMEVAGNATVLDRYAVSGLVWGRETLWLDAAERLVALVTVDAEYDHFEAVREDFAPALGSFVARAASDGMASLATLAANVPGERAPRIAVVGGRLIDGTGAEPLDDSVVVIEAGRITAVGKRSEVAIPVDAKVVDAHGMSVLPGLWDMHAHFEQVEWGPVYLAAGVTTVRDCGNELDFITACRDAIASHRGLGPRILAAGIVDGDSPRAIGLQRVYDEASAREWVARYHDRGFQQIKIYSSVPLDVLAMVAREAHRLGMTVTGHVPNGITLRQAVEAGQDQVNHVMYVVEALGLGFDEQWTAEELGRRIRQLDVDGEEAQGLYRFLREHRTVVDPTLAFTEVFSAGPDRPLTDFEPGAARVAPELAAGVAGTGTAADMLPLARAMFAKQLATVAALHRAGVTIVAGTDQTIPGHSLHRELELYVQAGFTPLAAIQSATLVPARVMGLEAELGTIAAGKRADLILVDGDPLRDIHDIRKVRSVVADGAVYECAALWRSVGFRP